MGNVMTSYTNEKDFKAPKATWIQKLSMLKWWRKIEIFVSYVNEDREANKKKMQSDDP